MRSLGKTLLSFALLHFVFRGQIFPLLQVSFDFLLFHAVLYNEDDIFFWMFVLESLVGLHKTFQLQLLQYCWWGIDLNYCDIELFVLEMNRDHFVILRLHPRTVFRALLSTMMTTPFLLRDSCPQ